MCGICGEPSFDATSPDLAVIERMSETLARRGPDHAGTYADGPLAFGHRRLAIIDLSPSADQPMMSHDVIAFYLLSERVSKEVKAVLAGQGADEVFGGYFWYPLMDAETGSAVERFGRHYFDRDHAEYLQMIAPAWQPPGAPDVTTELVAHELAKPQADTFLDEVWRFDATTLIVDDPVKRVDNMPMAWSLEVRVPFLDHELVEPAARMPPELKLKEGGKFSLKAISRGVIPDAVIDRPKGYFPVPAPSSRAFVALMEAFRATSGIAASVARLDRGCAVRNAPCDAGSSAAGRCARFETRRRVASRAPGAIEIAEFAECAEFALCRAQRVRRTQEAMAHTRPDREQRPCAPAVPLTVHCHHEQAVH